MTRKWKYAAGIGGGLIGLFFLFHWHQKRQAEARMAELRRKVASGEISARQFLEAILLDGQPLPGGPTVTVEEAKRLPCSTIFSPAIMATPGFDFTSALAELRRNGTCI